MSIKKVAVQMLLLVGLLYAPISSAGNHWTPLHLMKKINIWSSGVFIYVEGNPAIINLANCQHGTGYIIPFTSPIFDELYKATLTASAAKIKVQLAISDDPSNCVGGQPSVVAISVQP